MSLVFLSRLRGFTRGWGLGVKLAGTVAILLILVAALAPLLAPHDPNTLDVLNVLQSSSGAHPLGTDSYGRDLLSRLLYGSRTALIGPLIVVMLSTLIGTGLGIAGAWNRGWADALIGRLFDLAFSFPSLLLALLVVTVMSPGLVSAALALSIAYIPWVGRLARATALREVNEPYVEALRLQGMSAWQISVRHVLTNISGVILAQATMSFGFAMVDLAGISFLGLGVQEPTADWGTMIQFGETSIVRGYPQEALYAGAALVLAAVTFIALGDALSERYESNPDSGALRRLFADRDRRRGLLRRRRNAPHAAIDETAPAGEGSVL
jgi:peptide/nickel transport system permease protein